MCDCDSIPALITLEREAYACLHISCCANHVSYFAVYVLLWQIIKKGKYLFISFPHVIAFPWNSRKCIFAYIYVLYRIAYFLLYTWQNGQHIIWQCFFTFFCTTSHEYIFIVSLQSCFLFENIFGYFESFFLHNTDIIAEKKLRICNKDSLSPSLHASYFSKTTFTDYFSILFSTLILLFVPLSFF